MIPKSGNRFSEKITLKQRSAALRGGPLWRRATLRLGWRGRLRSALDRRQTPRGEGVDARPGATEIGQHDRALATLVGAEVDLPRMTGTLDHLALGHAERDRGRDHRDVVLRLIA